jgi:hypothetical protein
VRSLFAGNVSPTGPSSAAGRWRYQGACAQEVTGAREGAPFADPRGLTGTDSGVETAMDGVGNGFPPISGWERDVALATYHRLVRDLSHTDRTELWMRLSSLTDAQRAMVYGWITLAVATGGHG